MIRNIQEAFNLAFVGLRGQGFTQSIANYGNSRGCAYRGDNNTKCAIGHCIPDELYPRVTEGNDAEGVMSEIPELFDKRNRRLESQLNALQSIHDHCDVPELMERELREFAKSRHLTVPE